jgi:hypothetical protein
MAAGFFALDRAETIAFLMKAIETLDDQSLTFATHTLVSSYRPWLLKDINKVVTDKSVERINLGDDKPPYVPPPRIRDAEKNWPYMRCKNIAYALNHYNSKPIPRSHHALLEYLAKTVGVNVETLKKVSPYELFNGNFHVMNILCKR